MTIWIDPPAWPAHDRLWSHLVSDTSYEELHEFASAQGISRRAFEGDHYDVPADHYAALVAAGAREVGGRDLVRILIASGLRIQKRRHERVVHSTQDAPWLPVGGRADVIASRQDDAPSATVVVRLAIMRGPDLLVVEREGVGPDLPMAAVGPDGPAATLAVLRSELFGRVHLPMPSLLGYVRNTVTLADADYPWPVPKACFAIFLDHLLPADDADHGTWLDLAAAAPVLSDRHWWPLLADPRLRR